MAVFTSYSPYAIVCLSLMRIGMSSFVTSHLWRITSSPQTSPCILHMKHCLFQGQSLGHRNMVSSTRIPPLEPKTFRINLCHFVTIGKKVSSYYKGISELSYISTAFSTYFVPKISTRYGELETFFVLKTTPFVIFYTLLNTTIVYNVNFLDCI